MRPDSAPQSPLFTPTAELLGDRSTHFPGAKSQGIADRMHDAGPNLPPRKNRIDRFLKPLQAIDNGDGDVRF